MKRSLEGKGDLGQMLAVLWLARLIPDRPVVSEGGQPAMAGALLTFSGVDRAENDRPVDQLRPPVAYVLRPDVRGHRSASTVGVPNHGDGLVSHPREAADHVEFRPGGKDLLTAEVRLRPSWMT
jgi:hypothetical protein